MIPFLLDHPEFAALIPSQWMQISVYSCVIIHPGTEWECQISDMTLAMSADWQLGTWRKGWDQCSDWQRLSIPWHPFFLCSHLSVSCFQLKQAAHLKKKSAMLNNKWPKIGEYTRPYCITVNLYISKTHVANWKSCCLAATLTLSFIALSQWYGINMQIGTPDFTDLYTSGSET